MATALKKTNVVIVGLGAAGGVACLPIAEAGLEVIGLEAGSWLSTKDMAPDELKLNRGLWPPGPQKTKLEGVTVRANASQTAARANHPMMNAVGGTSVQCMAQSWRLNPLGIPVIRITAEFKDNERKIAAFIAGKMTQWYMEAGAVQTNGTGNLGNAMGASTHAYGGTRMGENPETNVADKWGFSHESPNLGLLGGSVMGSSGARNPTQTIQALAWRTAEHLVKNWKNIVS